MKKFKKSVFVTAAGIFAAITIPSLLFAPSTVSSIAVLSQVDTAEFQRLQNEIKYLRTELRNEAAAARSAREEARRLFEALLKYTKV